ncbi:MAG: arsenate reductase (glutaredoxin) [Pseudomonadota bacterium]
MDVVIHHNPSCGTSRNVLRLVRDAGYDPVVVEYLQVGWTRSQLQALFAAAGMTARQALRTTKSPAAELGLLNPDVFDEVLLERMVEHPILVNRPLVVTRKGVRLCRPVGEVLDLLEAWPPGPWSRDNGEAVIDENGERVLE